MLVAVHEEALGPDQVGFGKGGELARDLEPQLLGSKSAAQTAPDDRAEVGRKTAVSTDQARDLVGWGQGSRIHDGQVQPERQPERSSLPGCLADGRSGDEERGPGNRSGFEGAGFGTVDRGV